MTGTEKEKITDETVAVFKSYSFFTAKKYNVTVTIHRIVLINPNELLTPI
jgi:hypothetical protein